MVILLFYGFVSPEETEDDKKFGMCPENYLRTHPEFKEKMHNKFLKKHKQHQHDGQCNGTDCSEKHKEKYLKHFHKFSAKADCSVDGDCSDQMRCCRTICGKKCMKPVFSKYLVEIDITNVAKNGFSKRLY